MDEFLDKLATGIVKGADVITETAEQIAGKATTFVDKGIARLDKVKLEQQRDKEFAKLGEMLYEMMRSDSLKLDTLRSKCEEIAVLNGQIDVKREECKCTAHGEEDCTDESCNLK